MGRHACFGIAMATLLAGCTRAPSLVVFGASFPDWLFCVSGGVIATVVVHLLRGDRKRLRWLDPVALSYPLLTALFSLLAWVMFFPR